MRPRQRFKEMFAPPLPLEFLAKGDSCLEQCLISSFWWIWANERGPLLRLGNSSYPNLLWANPGALANAWEILQNMVKCHNYVMNQHNGAHHFIDMLLLYDFHLSGSVYCF